MSDSGFYAVVVLLMAAGAAAVAALAVRLTRPEKYCSKCGAPMHWRASGAGFDPDTGRPRTWQSWDCSKGGYSWDHDIGFYGRYVS